MNPTNMDFDNSSDIYTSLKTTNIFSSINESQFQKIQQLAQVERFKYGDKVYDAGDPANNVFILTEGEICFKLYLEGRESNAGRINEPGTFFGWTGLMDHIPTRLATAKCEADSTLIVLDGSKLLDLCEKDHDLGYHVMKQLSKVITSTLTAFSGG